MKLSMLYNEGLGDLFSTLKRWMGASSEEGKDAEEAKPNDADNLDEDDLDELGVLEQEILSGENTKHDEMEREKLINQFEKDEELRIEKFEKQAEEFRREIEALEKEREQGEKEHGEVSGINRLENDLYFNNKPDQFDK